MGEIGWLTGYYSTGDLDREYARRARHGVGQHLTGVEGAIVDGVAEWSCHVSCATAEGSTGSPLSLRVARTPRNGAPVSIHQPPSRGATFQHAGLPTRTSQRLERVTGKVRHRQRDTGNSKVLETCQQAETDIIGNGIRTSCVVGLR